MRLRGLIRKEFLQIVRDPSSIAIAFLLPVVLLLLFGYGVSLDAEHVRLAFVVGQPDAEVSSFISGFQQSKYFEPQILPDMHTAEHALLHHRIDGIVRFQNNFTERLDTAGDAPVQVILNGVDANTARLVSGYIEGVWLDWMIDRARTQGRILEIPVSIDQRVWFNSEVRSRNFLIPGLIAVIMTLIGALLTAMVVSREWERGTYEAIMVTPVTVREMLLGKLIPYFLMGMGGLVLSVAMGIWIFDVPLRGSIPVLFAASSLFLLAALGMGLLISIAAKNQFVAGQVAIIVTFLPAFLLSGFMFDIDSMPEAVQWVTRIIAARYYVSILQTVFLAGDIWPVILPNALALVILAGVLLGASRIKTRKRLD